MIVMEQILGDTCSLGFPVTPDSHCAVMEMIAAYGHINCCVQLNACNLCTGKLLHIVDMMNVIILDY